VRRTEVERDPCCIPRMGVKIPICKHGSMPDSSSYSSPLLTSSTS
jgi:hypothetical protein